MSILILLQKNASSDQTIEALTGLDKEEDIGKIIAVNGNTKLNWWSGQCNEIKLGSVFIFLLSFSLKYPFLAIRGTDGFAHPPNLTKNDKVHIYNENMCRTIPLEFEKEIVDGNGIPGFRLYTKKAKPFLNHVANFV